MRDAQGASVASAEAGFQTTWQQRAAAVDDSDTVFSLARAPPTDNDAAAASLRGSMASLLIAAEREDGAPVE